jgi:hypothetical protein
VAFPIPKCGEQKKSAGEGLQPLHARENFRRLLATVANKSAGLDSFLKPGERGQGFPESSIRDRDGPRIGPFPLFFSLERRIPMFSCFTRRMIALLNRTHLAVVPSRSRRPCNRQRAFRPQLEILPSRIAPSVDLWTGANHDVDINWSDGGNWSLGHAPGSGDIADFTNNSNAVKDAESVDNISATIGELKIDGSWGDNLTIGTLNNPVTLTLASGSTNEWDSGTLNLDGSNGTLINNGTLTLNNAGLVFMSGGGTFTNNGTLNLTNTGTLDLGGGNNLDLNLNNSAGATIDFQNNGSIEAGGEVVISNAGLIEKTSGTGTSEISSGGPNTTFVNTGTLDVANGTLNLGIDTTGTNGTFQTAKGTLLDLTSGTFTQKGNFTATGAGEILLGGADATLAAGSSGATFNIANTTAFDWTAGSINVASNATLTFNGTLTLNNAGLVFMSGGGTFTNNGTLNLTNTGTLDLGGGNNLDLNLNNSAGATIDFHNNASIEAGGEVVISNAGLIEKTGGTGTSEISSGGPDTTLANTGTIEADSGTLYLNFDNISQVAGNTLSAGTWNALNGATLEFPNGTNITTNKAHISLAGSGANITGLSGLSSNSGSLSLTNGANFTTSGDLNNSGSLTLGTGSTLSVGGNFNQAAAGALNIAIGGTPASGQFGQVAVQKAANLAGNFKVSLVNGFTPSKGQDFKVMNFASASGTFNSVSGVSPDFIEQLNSTSLDLVAGNATGAPIITGNPSNQAVTAGQSVSFTASASGTPTPAVQWQVSTDGGNTWSNLSGATSTTLTLNNVTPAMSGTKYEAVFTNSAGSVVTSAATLTVQEALPPPLPLPPPPPPPSPVLNVPPLLAILVSLLGPTETVNADGSVTETTSFFGIQLLVSAFDSSGNLESVTLFGMNITFLFELPSSGELPMD